MGKMDSRRGGRSSQVRPRPPSTGRPPASVPRRPVSARVASHQPIERPRGLPLVAKAILAVALVALAGVVVWSATGQLPRLVGAIGDTIGGIADKVFTTPSPSPTPVAIIPAPHLDPPAEPYTNQATIDVTGTVPAELAGRTGYTIRIWIALPDQLPVQVKEVAVGETPAFVVPAVPLEKGNNDITATIHGPGGDSDSSPIITYIRDVTKPKVTITSPKNGATINNATVKISGKTQGRSAINARNAANGDVGTTTAKTDGTFSVTVALADGANAITVTATDPAGNSASAVVSVRRGSGKLTVKLSASVYRLSAAKLPRALVLTAVVTNPDGAPIPGATVSFTLSIPGVEALTGEAKTNASGVATFRTTVPSGATVGSGPGTALVSTTEFGDASGRVTITITK